MNNMTVSIPHVFDSIVAMRFVAVFVKLKYILLYQEQYFITDYNTIAILFSADNE